MQGGRELTTISELTTMHGKVDSSRKRNDDSCQVVINRLLGPLLRKPDNLLSKNARFCPLSCPMFDFMRLAGIFPWLDNKTR